MGRFVSQPARRISLINLFTYLLNHLYSLLQEIHQSLPLLLNDVGLGKTTPKCAVIQRAVKINPALAFHSQPARRISSTQSLSHPFIHYSLLYEILQLLGKLFFPRFIYPLSEPVNDGRITIYGSFWPACSACQWERTGRGGDRINTIKDLLYYKEGPFK